jgi:hypothetical protein
MTKVEKIQEWFGDDVELLFADGFNDAILGVDFSTHRVVYSIERCLEILETKEGMNAEDAMDHFYYNVAGAWVGEDTPIWMHELEKL